MTHEHFFFFAGELSGDMYGAKLLHALKHHFPDVEMSGVGGQEMRAQGLDTFLNTEDFEVMGFSDVLRQLPKLAEQFYRIRDHIINTNPTMALFIDSPGLSLRMAKALRKKGYKGKLVQYICPAVWAWGKERISFIAAHFDLLLTILPFEAPLFAETSLRVEYVGHPLQEVIASHRYDPNWQMIMGIKKAKNLIGLFPGSRKGEIKRNLPGQLEAAKLMQKAIPDCVFAISCAHEHNMELVQTILNKSNLQLNRDLFFIPKIYSYELMRSCRSAIAKSGTVNLELALHKCPTVVIYKLTLLNRLIAKYFLKVNLPNYCIVNILAGKRIFPEMIASGFTPESLYHSLKELHIDSIQREQCLDECGTITSLLNEKEASVKAALAISQLFSTTS